MLRTRARAELAPGAAPSSSPPFHPRARDWNSHGAATEPIYRVAEIGPSADAQLDDPATGVECRA
eukprot:10807251-Alexandrium_andersonii.AAC.1